eukprot:5543226-Pleurochrysis_carterae.AAC.3
MGGIGTRQWLLGECEAATVSASQCAKLKLAPRTESLRMRIEGKSAQRLACSGDAVEERGAAAPGGQGSHVRRG